MIPNLPDHGMPIEKTYAFKSRTEHAIDKYVGIKSPTSSDLNDLKVAGQIEAGIFEMLNYVQ